MNQKKMDCTNICAEKFGLGQSLASNNLSHKSLSLILIWPRSKFGLKQFELQEFGSDQNLSLVKVWPEVI